mgnify:FL=1
MNIGIIIAIISLFALILVAVVFARKKGATKEPIIEPVFEFYSDGNLKKEFYVKYFKSTDPKLKTGEEKIYYPTGKLNKTITWENGKRNGEVTIYYRSGNHYVEGMYKKDKLCGSYIVRDENGGVIYSKRF